MKQYYQINNTIYRFRPNHNDYLQMTNCDCEHDRRIQISDFSTCNPMKIKANQAENIINNYWNELTPVWNHNGDTYTAEPDACKAPDHLFKHTYETRTGESRSYNTSYKLVWHQGNLYWGAYYGTYIPRIQLWEFTDVDTEPKKFCKWTKITNCKQIINCKTGQPI